MARRTLPALFRSWAFKSRRLGRRHPDAVVLGLETFEDRVVPATLPIPTVVTPNVNTATFAAAGTYFNPQVVPNPADYTQQVLVATSGTGTSTQAVYAYSGTSGAAFTAPAQFGLPTDPLTGSSYTNSSSPAVSFGRDGTIYFVYLAHNAAKTSGAVVFAQTTLNGSPGATKILYQWTNTEPARNPTIAVDNNLASFTDPETNAVFTDTLATRTTGRQAVYVAWNGDGGATPGDLQADAAGIIHYNTNPILAAVSGDNGATWSNPTPVSDGGYLTNPTNVHGAAPQIAISPGTASAPGSLVFVWPENNGGSSNSTIAYEITRPDSGLTTTYVPQAYTLTQTFDASTGKINDGLQPPASPPPPPNTSDTHAPKTFDLVIPAGYITDPSFTLQDLSVDLALVSSHLDHLRIQLQGPNGTLLTLLNNRIDDLGNNTTPSGSAFNTGVASPPAVPIPQNNANTYGGLGVANGVYSQTVFSDAAARRINDPVSQWPYIGTYRAEGGSITKAVSQTALLNQFLTSEGLLNRPASAINGTTWHLIVEDFRDDRYTNNNLPYDAPQFLKTFGLTFSSVKNDFGTDRTIAGTVAPPIGTDYNNAPLQAVNGVTVAPSFGISPAVSIAFDTSLGSYTPYGGSLYVAYTSVATGNPDVAVVRGNTLGSTLFFGIPVKVNDDSTAAGAPNDNFTEGDRSQFLPAVTVDPVTGTVVATWYDTRLDAAKNRAATFVATSIDGGASWSSQTQTTADSARVDLNGNGSHVTPFLNQPKDAIDTITTEVNSAQTVRYTLQPVPTNVPQVGTNGLGIRQSVLAYGGNIYAYWAGNSNAAGLGGIYSAHAVTAAGPRVIGGDSGPVTSGSLSSFVVTFDRQVEAASAADPTSATNPNNYTIRYHNPYDAIGTDTVLNPATVTVTSLGGNSFRVSFPAQTAVGTYSYAVSPRIRDRIRSITGGVTSVGNATDQNANAVTGETTGGGTFGVDSFAAPSSVKTVNGIPGTLPYDNAAPFALPYATASFPLSIPGPRVSGSSVPNYTPNGGSTDTSMVLAGVATAVDVTFNQPMNTDPTAGLTFTTGNVVRITGPAGVIYDRATFAAAAANATLDGAGGITSVTVTAGGSGYTTPPTVRLVGGSGTYATATATVVNGVVTGVAVVGATGYFGVAPAVVFDLPISVTTPGVTAPAPATTFRVGFPAQVLSGTYTVEVDPLIAAATPLPGGSISTRPALVDTNQNAGIDVIRGGTSPTLGTPINTSYTANFSGAQAVIPPAVAGVPGQRDFVLNVPDTFVIALNTAQRAADGNFYVPKVLLNISNTVADNNHAADLIADLIAPDGTTTIRLFTNAGQPGQLPVGTVWFSNTTLDDTAATGTSIQSGFQPFSAGPYTPQFPLAALSGLVSNGANPWKLRITNTGTETPNLTSWQLSLPRVSGGTGLGQPTADRISVSFRVFNQDPTDPLTQKTWTAVGPAAEDFEPRSSRTNGLAVDPSDPSGNTVYLGAASGGVWKTTNFLTQDSAGPTWVPLTDSGPTYSLNVVSIALFPRNNDPSQTIVFALTGEGDTFSPGVGVLRSMDGGKTWAVLDSLDNSDVGPNGFGGNVTAITAATRGHDFVGKTGSKIVVDPTATANTDKDVVVYAAFATIPGGPVGGLYRSTDTGRHWTLLKQGDATDVVLAEGSQATNTNQLQIVYAAFRGDGVYRGNPAYAVAPGGLVQLTGNATGFINGQFIDANSPTNQRIANGGSNLTPNGNKGRLLLATPALTSNKIKDLNYQGWLYALAVSQGDSLDGLYLTKDYGANWTKVAMPELILTTLSGQKGYGTNNYGVARDHDPFAAPPGAVNPLPGQGNYDVAFAIDPNNPNVVYIGGTNDTAVSLLGAKGGLVRVDTTGVMDAGAVVGYDNGLAAGGGATQFGSAGGAGIQTPGTAYGFGSLTGTNTGYLNVLRTPSDPFTANPQLYFQNVSSIRNTGFGARISGFPAEVETDIHRIITMVDPITGLTRLIVGDDQGVGTAVDDGKGNLTFSVGTGARKLNLPSLVRNGNLQTVQFYSSTTHPSQLAAEIAGAMFYGIAQDDGFPVSNSAILQTGLGSSAGKLSWAGPGGDGSWGLTDQTGSGTYYDYLWPCCGGGENFFQVNGTARVFGLVQPTDNPTTGAGNWAKKGGPKFAVNPIDKNGLLISSAVLASSGRTFRSVDQGVTWFEVAGPDAGYTNFGQYAQALAFGSPDVGANQAQFNNFMYAGAGSSVFVTFTGGSPWKNISTGISGTVQQIVPDPTRGSKAAYAVTDSGVFFLPDASAAAPAWVNITNGLFKLTDPIFSDPNPGPATGAGAVNAYMKSLTALAVDWRYAIPDKGVGAPSAFYPVLYAGGYGGVVRSLDRGKTWEVYPTSSSYSTPYVDQTTLAAGTVTTTIPTGGYFPSDQVTQLTLALGNINPLTGQPVQQTGGLDLLTAATYGRGTWSIRLGTPDTDPAIAAIAQYQVVPQSGPRVLGVNPAAAADQYYVEFDAPVLASTFVENPGAFRLTDANGNLFVGTGVVAVANNVHPYGTTLAAGTVADYHNKFLVTIARDPSDPNIGNGVTTPVAGFSRVTVGSTPSAATPAPRWDTIADYAGFGMNQDGDGTNGERAVDPNNGFQAADAYSGYVYSQANGVDVFLSMPVVTTAGDPTKVVVSVRNPNTGLPLSSYTGTVHFSVANDPLLAAAGLPADYKFTPSDAGIHTFTIQFKTATAPVPTLYRLDPQTRLTVTEVPGPGAVGANPAQADITVDPALATHFRVTGLADPTTAGAAQAVTVTALDPFDNVDPSYTGTVTLTSTDVKASTVIPAAYTFTGPGAGNDNGVHVFDPAGTPPNGVTLTTAGTQTLFADDATNPNRTLHGEQTVLVLPAAPTQVILTGADAITPLPATVTAGAAFSVTVTLKDQFDNLATNYVGAVHFTSSDQYPATLPADYTFTSGAGAGFDNGAHTFDAAGSPANGVTLKTVKTGPPGTQSLTVTTVPVATVPPTPPASGTANIAVTPAAVSRVDVTAFPDPVIAGTPGSVTVKLFDAYGNLATNSTDVITLTTTDPHPGTVPSSPPPPPASPPGSYKFTAADKGVHTFPATAAGGVTLFTAGLQTITATDNATAASGFQTVTVKAAAAKSLTVTNFPDPVVAGVAGAVTVKLFDQYGNIADGFTGKVHFTSTDVKASTVLPADYTFTAGDAGVHVFDPAGAPPNGVTLTTAGTQTITVTTLALPTNFAGSQTVLVSPNVTKKFQVVGYPSPTVAGTVSSVTVTAQDLYGNLTPTYTGTVQLTSSDNNVPFTQLPAAAPFLAAENGVHTFAGVKLTKAGTQTITATDTGDPTVFGTQTVQITPGHAVTMDVAGFPASVVAGSSNTVTVTMRDLYGNIDTNFQGTVTLTSTDPQALSLGSYLFKPADAGVHQFAPVKLFTATNTTRFPGTHTIYADTPGVAQGSEANIQVTPAATFKFAVTGFPSPVQAGTPGAVTVTAQDQYGNTTPAYVNKTVHFTSSDVKSSTALPADYTFTAGDAGVHVFDPAVSPPGGVTLTTAGTQSITATEKNGTITGSQTGIQVTAAPAESLTVAGFPPQVVAGVARTFTVTARDHYGNAATSFRGTVHFASTDLYPAALPADYPFTAADNGVHTFAATLFTATGTPTFSGTHTITATSGGVTAGAQSGIQVLPAAPETVVLSGFPATVTAGDANAVTVTLFDPYGNKATNYLGTVHFSSSDTKGTTQLPADYPFTVGDAGAHTFSPPAGVVLTTAGLQTLTVTTDNGKTGSVSGGVQVNPAATYQFVVAGIPATVTAGQPASVTVTAQDRYGNRTPAYAGTVQFTSTDTKGSTALPVDYTFLPGTDAGVHTFTNEVTLTTAGTQSVTATDSIDPTITGEQAGILVTPAAPTQVLVTGFPTAVRAGDPGTVTVTLRDTYDNLATNYTGTVTFTSSDTNPQTVLPTPYPFTLGDAGSHTFTNGVTLTKATGGLPTAQIVATAATVNGPVAGAETGITVTAAPANHLAITGLPANTVAGTALPFAVTALDRFNNVDTGYVGGVGLTTTDPLGVLPTPPGGPLTNGTANFSVELRKAGTWTVKATDGTSGLSVTSSGVTVAAAQAQSLTLSVAVPVSGKLTAGVPADVTVTLKDRFLNVATGYRGTVAFTTSDGAGSFTPQSYPFTAGDAGVHTFPGGVTLRTAGAQTVTAADGGLTDTRNVTVASAAASRLALTGLPAFVDGGAHTTLTVTGYDPFNNVATGYTGPVSVTSSDPLFVGTPTSVTLTAGVGTFDAVLDTRGSQSVTVTDPAKPALTATQSGTVFYALQPVVAVGSGAGGSQTVTLYDGAGNPTDQFPDRYGGGSRVVVADFNNDGVPDLAVGTGPGVGADITVFDGKTKNILFTDIPFAGFYGGVFLAAGHVTGTGRTELIVTPDLSGGPRVKIYSPTPAGQPFKMNVMADFYGIEDPNFRGGARAAAGDIDGDGFDDVVVSAGFGGGPRISVYDGKALAGQDPRFPLKVFHPVPDFYAFEDTLRNGAYVAVGDIDGDHKGDLIFGAGPGGGPRVLAISGQTLLSGGGPAAALQHPLVNLFAGNVNNRNGVRVASKDFDGDGHADIAVGDGEGSGSTVTAYSGAKLLVGNDDPLYQFDAFPGINAGVFVG